MKKALKILLFGIIIWLIPFIMAFFFYTPAGQLSVDIFLFKTIMLLIGNLTGVIFLVIYLRKTEKNYLKESIIIGLIWLLINYILDFVILLPMSKMSVGDYFIQIGLRYLLLPVVSIGFGYLLNKKIA